MGAISIFSDGGMRKGTAFVMEALHAIKSMVQAFVERASIDERISIFRGKGMNKGTAFVMEA
eukprot:1161508-Pelagomonas_calceolata.AAC.19